MTNIAALVADNLDLWTSAIDRKSSGGRGGGKKLNLYGIERLRALILDLAVRGKLVPQEGTEEPAADSLRAIANARRQKLEAGVARKPKALAPLPVDLSPLPKGWAWTQLGMVAEISPRNSVDDETEASFVPMSMISTSISGEHEYEVRKWGDIKKGFTQFANGDIGLAKITPCFENGKAALFQNLKNGIGAGTTELLVARPWSDDINRRYLLLNMKTGSYFAHGEREMTGTAGQKRVTRTYFEASPLPLPPLAEQQRIVAKVDELMALCDALEQESADALAAHQALVETLLAKLLNSADVSDLATNWTRLATHFDTLFTTEASIEALKKTILEVAVAGGLARKTEGLDRTSAPLSKIIGPMDSGWSPDCYPFAARTDDTWGVLKTTAVQFLEYQSEQNKELPEKLTPRSGAECRAGDILVTRAGPINRVGICCYVFETRPRLMISDKIIRFRPASSATDGAYLALALSVGDAAAQIEKAKSGMAASQVNISQSKLREVVVSLPPLAEQQGVVAKVHELMALCDALKARLADAAATQKELTDAIVQRAAA